MLLSASESAFGKYCGMDKIRLDLLEEQNSQEGMSRSSNSRYEIAGKAFHGLENGVGEYDLLQRNSSHIARCCCQGRRESEQARDQAMSVVSSCRDNVGS
ncbi:unnamed protein product [Darwinula stevensoni]|uniref:Uncharacterized protein n=1 Tax=Darwinula stevensoni TaxID=69355 RepID=A0A7R8X961_9CRUS|nr:unnamed protein product [Darwinula stevensoni]CAG0882265.1 unnamed protein product [Darwinula stevensoni]